MNNLLYFVLLIFIAVNSFAKSFSKEIISMSSNNAEDLNDIPIRGSVFISTVYPCTELDSRVIDMVDYIDQAYSLAGKEVIKVYGSEKYYPAPLSYPYKFSKNGISTIIKNLQDVRSIEHDSVKIRSFPNIHKHEQYLFKSDLEKILVKEEYIRFKMEGWHNVHFMKFPTFVVMNFDFVDQKATSFRDYERYKAYWREKSKEFDTNENLMKVLGIARRNHGWSPVPQLVFVSLDTYTDEKFMNRYFPFGSDESINMERQHAFLRELSLLEHPEDLSLSAVILRYFESYDSPFISHEYYITNNWRFYYLPYPLFYDGNAFTDRGSPRYMARILRSVLFAHVVLPFSVDKLRLLETKIKNHVSNLRNKRLEFFDAFRPKDITEFHAYLQDENNVHREIETELERVREVQNGAKRMFLHFDAPGRSLGFPLDHPLVRGASRLIEGYRKLLHFEEPQNDVNDRRVVENSTNELDSLSASLEKALPRYDNEIKSSMELIENRRQLWESQMNTFLAIIIPAAGALVLGSMLLFWKVWIRITNLLGSCDLPCRNPHAPLGPG